MKAALRKGRQDRFENHDSVRSVFRRSPPRASSNPPLQLRRGNFMYAGFWVASPRRWFPRWALPSPRTAKRQQGPSPKSSGAGSKGHRLPRNRREQNLQDVGTSIVAFRRTAKGTRFCGDGGGRDHHYPNTLNLVRSYFGPASNTADSRSRQWAQPGFSDTPRRTAIYLRR